MPTNLDQVRPCVSRARLEARLLNDQYDLSEHPNDAHAHGWVAAMRHVQHVILPSLDAYERVLDALRELRDAPREMDLRLKEALVFDERVLHGEFDLSDAEVA